MINLVEASILVPNPDSMLDYVVTPTNQQLHQSFELGSNNILTVKVLLLTEK